MLVRMLVRDTLCGTIVSPSNRSVRDGAFALDVEVQVDSSLLVGICALSVKRKLYWMTNYPLALGFFCLGRGLAGGAAGAGAGAGEESGAAAAGAGASEGSGMNAIVMDMDTSSSALCTRNTGVNAVPCGAAWGVSAGVNRACAGGAAAARARVRMRWRR